MTFAAGVRRAFAESGLSLSDVRVLIFRLEKAAIRVKPCRAKRRKSAAAALMTSWRPFGISFTSEESGC